MKSVARTINLESLSPFVYIKDMQCSVLDRRTTQHNYVDIARLYSVCTTVEELLLICVCVSNYSQFIYQTWESKL